MLDWLRFFLGHQILPKVPKNVIHCQNYVKVMSKIYDVPEPQVFCQPLGEGILGFYDCDKSIYIWRNPTYEVIVWHEFMHYVGQVKFGSPFAIIAERYECMTPTNKNKNSLNNVNHPFCGTCIKKA